MEKEQKLSRNPMINGKSIEDKNHELSIQNIDRMKEDDFHKRHRRLLENSWYGIDPFKRNKEKN